MFEMVNNDGTLMTDAEIAELAAGALYSVLMDFIRAADGRVDWSDPAAIRRGVDACEPVTNIFVDMFGKDRGTDIILDVAGLLLSLRD